MKEIKDNNNGGREISTSEDFCKKWEIAWLKTEKEDYAWKEWDRMGFKGCIEKEKINKLDFAKWK